MEASPSKRRALGPLDPNALSPKPQPGLKHLKPPAPQSAPGSPLKRLAGPTSEPEPKKRQLTMDPPAEPAKKPSIDERAPCLREDRVAADAETIPPQQSPRPSDRHRSASPAASSLFDSSGLDNTQGTAITDPDVDTAAPATAPQLATYGGLPRPPARPRLTREQTREKAEILRLRLGLANYKLRTGQTDVPLERLQIRPLPGMARPRATPPPVVAAEGAPPRAEDEDDAGRPSVRRPLPVAPARRRSEDGEAGIDSAGSSQPSSQESSGSRGREDGERENVPRPHEGAAAANTSPERLGLPRLPSQQQQQAANTPRRRRLEEADAERLTSSALRGGAANGLLSLARG